MTVSDYKALTVINLPFIEERYAPGDMIPYSRFEECAAQGARLITLTEGEPPTADEMIQDLIKYGSLSEDAGAPLHPDSVIRAPGAVTLESLVASADELIAELEERGADVPAKLRQLASISERQIQAADTAFGGEQA